MGDSIDSAIKAVEDGHPDLARLIINRIIIEAQLEGLIKLRESVNE